MAVSRGSLVVAAAVPLLFLHSEFQPSLSISAGGTSLNAYLSDFAVLAVVVTALAVAFRSGVSALRPAVALWAASAAFFVWLVVELFWGKHETATYPLATHGVTAAKFLEYALLAPSLALLLRTRRDTLLVLWSFALWSCAATVVGIAEFFGADVGAKGTVGHRQASFLSSADFAALSAGALLVGAVGVALPRLAVPRALTAIAIVTGVFGTIVAGAVASVLGLATALVILGVLVLLQHRIGVRRALLVGVVALVTAAGVGTIRGRDLSAFARFLGASSAPAATRPAKVQTYAHRTLLAWIGYRIWLDHPLLGVGWEGSAEPANFERYLPAARKRFPDESPQAFPSAAPGRQYGVQDVWLQALADLGVVGLLLWAGVFAAAAWVAARARRTLTGVLALVWIGLLAWLWSAQGFIAGIPLDALTWLAFGFGATRLRAA